MSAVNKLRIRMASPEQMKEKEQDRNKAAGRAPVHPETHFMRSNRKEPELLEPVPQES